MDDKISIEYRATMNRVAKSIDTSLNGAAVGGDRKVGFVLLTFPFDGPDNARTNYISNADRKDIVVAMKEIVARFEGQAHVTGRA